MARKCPACGQLIGRPRSRQQENWFRLFCRKIGEATDRHEDWCYSEFKFRAGKIKYVTTGPDGFVRYELKSATEMDSKEYSDVVEKAIDYTCKELLPKTDRQDLVRHIEEMLGPPPW
jgi:hypothetical protein